MDLLLDYFTRLRKLVNTTDSPRNIGENRANHGSSQNCSILAFCLNATTF